MQLLRYFSTLVVMYNIISLGLCQNVLHINCNPIQEDAKGSYDVIDSEYSTVMNISYPFTISQTIFVKLVYNETHNITYTQYCEVDDDTINQLDFIDSNLLHSSYKRVKATVTSFLVQSNGSFNLLDRYSPREDNDQDPAPRIEQDIELGPPRVRRHTGYLSIRTIESLRSKGKEMKRDIEDLYDEPPVAYTPSRSKSYGNLIKRAIKRQYENLIKGTRKRGRRSETSIGINEFGINILKKRIYRLENQFREVGYMLSVMIYTEIPNANLTCAQYGDILSMIKCMGMYYDKLNKSKYGNQIISHFYELMDKDKKISIETELYDTYNDELIKQAKG